MQCLRNWKTPMINPGVLGESTVLVVTVLVGAVLVGAVILFLVLR